MVSYLPPMPLTRY